MDLDFCERVESTSGLGRIKTNPGQVLGCHHPIWTPEELFKTRMVLWTKSSDSCPLSYLLRSIPSLDLALSKRFTGTTANVFKMEGP
jgi:hypothetical protein